MFEEIKSMSWNQTLTAIFGFLGVLAPGLLVVYLFNPNLFVSLDTVKLILFSVSLSGPIFVINMLIVINAKSDIGNPQALAIIGLFLSSVVLYTGVLASYLLAFSFKMFILVTGFIQIAVFGFLWFHDKRRKQHA